MTLRQKDRDQWDKRYRGDQLPWDTGRPSTELENLVRSGKVPVGKALELGCGHGTNALLLAERGFDVTAADVSPAAITAAKRRAVKKRLQVEFRVADLTAEPDLGGPYDFLFDRGLYHAIRLADVAAFLRLLRNVSREGTLYLCLCGNAKEKQEPGPPTVTEEEIRAELGSLFEILDLHEVRFDESPGKEGRPLGWSVFMRRVVRAPRVEHAAR